MEDGTSFSGNSNNVFTTSGGVGSGGHGVGGTGNAHGGVAGGVITGGEHLMMSSSAASTGKSLTLEAIPSATQFFKRSYKISHYPGL